MIDDRLERSSLVKFAGLALGIVIGGLIGPIVFTPLGLSIPTAATEDRSLERCSALQQHPPSSPCRGAAAIASCRRAPGWRRVSSKTKITSRLLLKHSAST